MNNKEKDPDNLGGLGDLLPADVLKKVNELLERLHQADKEHQGSTVINYYAPGSQHVDTQIIASPCPPPKRGGNTNGREKGAEWPALPEALSTEKAMVLWRKAQEVGYVDEHYQPLLSRTQAAILADEIAERLEIKEKWKAFETLWNRRNMYRDYHDALNQRQSLQFRDKLKELFR